jgi:hypothetical protein
LPALPASEKASDVGPQTVRTAARSLAPRGRVRSVGTADRSAKSTFGAAGGITTNGTGSEVGRAPLRTSTYIHENQVVLSLHCSASNATRTLSQLSPLQQGVWLTLSTSYGAAGSWARFRDQFCCC